MAENGVATDSAAEGQMQTPNRAATPLDSIMNGLKEDLERERQQDRGDLRQPDLEATVNNNELFNKRCVHIACLLEDAAYRLRRETTIIQERHRRRKPRIPRIITDHLLLITLLWQVLCVVILSIVDYFDKSAIRQRDTEYIVGMFFMTTFQAANLFLSIATTVKATKQYMHHTLTTSFLLQSYLSSVVLFTGIYAMIYRLDKKSFSDVDMNKSDKTITAILFIKMAFFSTSTATLCGTASINATKWYSQSFAAFQMLLSFVYFASILSQAISTGSESAVHTRGRPRPIHDGLSTELGSSTDFQSSSRSYDVLNAPKRHSFSFRRLCSS